MCVSVFSLLSCTFSPTLLLPPSLPPLPLISFPLLALLLPSSLPLPSPYPFFSLPLLLSPVPPSSLLLLSLSPCSSPSFSLSLSLCLPPSANHPCANILSTPFPQSLWALCSLGIEQKPGDFVFKLLVCCLNMFCRNCGGYKKF